MGVIDQLDNEHERAAAHQALSEVFQGRLAGAVHKGRMMLDTGLVLYPTDFEHKTKGVIERVALAVNDEGAEAVRAESYFLTESGEIRAGDEYRYDSDNSRVVPSFEANAMSAAIEAGTETSVLQDVIENLQEGSS